MNENDRLEIFTTFWEMQTWEARRKYVQALVTRQPIKQKKNINSSKRHISLSYVLKKEDGNVVPVCKEMFCNTLGVSKRTISSWTSDSFLDDTDDDDFQNKDESSKSPNSGKTQKVSEEDMNYLKTW